MALVLASVILRTLDAKGATILDRSLDGKHANACLDMARRCALIDQASGVEIHATNGIRTIATWHAK